MIQQKLLKLLGSRTSVLFALSKLFRQSLSCAMSLSWPLILEALYSKDRIEMIFGYFELKQARKLKESLKILKFRKVKNLLDGATENLGRFFTIFFDFLSIKYTF